MIPKECKRLAEVDFPIAVVSKHAVHEKWSSGGHPSTLHLWWARRPLAACRAILLGLLLPDPCGEYCIEAKRLGTEMEGALTQAKAYVTALGVARDVVVTDGIRYRMYEASRDFAPVAYANLARLKRSALALFGRMQRP